MGMMEVTIDQVIDVVAVRYGFMTASGTVHMVRRMATARVSGRAGIGIHIADFHDVFLDLAVVANVMQVPVMQVVNMVAVLDAGVLAVGSVSVIVVFVNSAH